MLLTGIIPFAFAKEFTIPAKTESLYTENFIQERREIDLKEFLIEEINGRIRYNNDLAILFEIIKRESNWDAEVCNKKIGCESGQGLFQIIPNTFKSCQKVISELEDAFNPFDNIKCGLWLYYETSPGICHWQNYSGPYNEARCP